MTTFESAVINPISDTELEFAMCHAMKKNYTAKNLNTINTPRARQFVKDIITSHDALKTLCEQIDAGTTLGHAVWPSVCNQLWKLRHYKQRQ